MASSNGRDAGYGRYKTTGETLKSVMGLERTEPFGSREVRCLLRARLSLGGIEG